MALLEHYGTVIETLTTLLHDAHTQDEGKDLPPASTCFSVLRTCTFLAYFVDYPVLYGNTNARKTCQAH